MYSVRIFEESDSEQVLGLVSDIIVNEFHFRLELEEGGLDSDLIHIADHYNRSGGCFWVTEENISKKMVGTAGIRKLKQFQLPTCELKRMYVLKSHRGLGIAQKMLDTAIQFATKSGYFRIVLDSSRRLTAARLLYLKYGFVDVKRYNDNHRADVFMQKVLVDY